MPDYVFNHQKIIRLNAENVKKLKAVEIIPKGNMVIIGGMNGQGKSSVLDAIWYAVTGKSAMPSLPVRQGADKATIVCELDDLIITRTITPTGGGTLKITNREGLQYSRPQEILDSLYSKISFDPLEFLRMNKKEQIQCIKDLVGLDFSDLDRKYQEIYEKRTENNRKIRSLEGALASIPYAADAPEEPLDVVRMVDQLAEEEKRERQQLSLAQELEEKKRKITLCQEKIDQFRARITQLEDEIRRSQAEIVRCEEEQASLQHTIDSIEPSHAEEIRQAIRNAQAINKKVENNQRYRQIQEDLEKTRACSESLTQALQDLAKERLNRISNAKMPIPGFTINEETQEVFYLGVPFDQCAASEQMRASISIAMACNPTLRVMRSKDGSLLDHERLAMIADMVRQNHYQFWLERVGDGEECSVIISDGTVVEEREADHELSH